MTMLNINQYPTEEDGWVKHLKCESEEAPKVVVKQRKTRRKAAAPAAEEAPKVEHTLHLVKPEEPPQPELPWKEEAKAEEPKLPTFATIVGQAGTRCLLAGEVYEVLLNDPDIKVFRKVNSIAGNKG